MGAEIDISKRLNAKMESSTYKTYGNFAQELEDELMKFTPTTFTPTTFEDSKVSAQLVENADSEVDITGHTKSVGNEVIQSEPHDTTENSSSFDGSGSETENDDTGNSEALSSLNGVSESSIDFDGFRDMFRLRKKKVTAHWRLFIQPLVWRCKWAELQMKKCLSHARKYERQLEKCSRQKNVEVEKSMLEDNVAKSLSFSRKNVKSEVLQRKKRKRIEATKDLAEYMSNHNLFSYYENRKSFNKVAFMENELKNPAKAAQKVDIDNGIWENDDLLLLESLDRDSSVEQVLRKIGNLQSRVVNLKNRSDKAISECLVDISYFESLNMPMPLVGTSQSTSQLASEYETGTKIEPGIEMKSHAGNDSTNVNGSKNITMLASSSNNGGDGALINEHKVKIEMHDNESIQRPLLMRNDSGSTAPVTEESDLPAEDQGTPKTRSIAKLTAPKTQARRGRRRGTGRWGRRYT